MHQHRSPENISDHIALIITKTLRFFADTFFAKQYGHRAVVLETVAAVPGMVGGMWIHLTCLRKMQSDRGWIKILLDEAENERMHLMTFIETNYSCCSSNLLEFLLFVVCFFPKNCP